MGPILGFTSAQVNTDICLSNTISKRRPSSGMAAATNKLGFQPTSSLLENPIMGFYQISSR